MMKHRWLQMIPVSALALFACAAPAAAQSLDELVVGASVK